MVISLLTSMIHKAITGLDFDYEEDFQKIRKEVRDKCVPDTTLWSEFHTCLLRFDRIKGYQLYYPSKIRLRKIFTLKN